MRRCGSSPPGVGAAVLADVLLLAFLMAVDFDAWALAATYVLHVAIVGVPLALMFELDLYETALAVAIGWAPRVVAVYLTAAAQPKWFGE